MIFSAALAIPAGLVMLAIGYFFMTAELILLGTAFALFAASILSAMTGGLMQVFGEATPSRARLAGQEYRAAMLAGHFADARRLWIEAMTAPFTTSSPMRPFLVVGIVLLVVGGICAIIGMQTLSPDALDRLSSTFVG